MVWTENVIIQMGAAGIVMAVLISFASMVLKNQAQSNRETVNAFTESMKDVATRMDAMINNISLISAQISRIVLESELRMQTSILSNRDAINALIAQVIEMQTRASVQSSTEHADARIKHADDVNSVIQKSVQEGDIKP